MFKIEELSGSLIRSGRFKDAIPAFHAEIRLALKHGVITEAEMFNLLQGFAAILLCPSDMFGVEVLSESMQRLALRIPDYVPQVSQEQFDANVKASREVR
jgi:hypothetical protein